MYGKTACPSRLDGLDDKVLLGARRLQSCSSLYGWEMTHGRAHRGIYGLGVAKAKHAVAVADEGRTGDVRYWGEITTDLASVRRMVAKLEMPGRRLHFCYEAAPTGYGLHRLLTAMGHACDVIAPSLIPRRAGDRMKTSPRDAIKLAKFLLAGELTQIWVPDEVHEATHELIRSRDVAVRDLRRKRQSISSMMLRYGPKRQRGVQDAVNGCRVRSLNIRRNTWYYRTLSLPPSMRRSDLNGWRSRSRSSCPNGRWHRLLLRCRH